MRLERRRENRPVASGRLTIVQKPLGHVHLYIGCVYLTDVTSIYAHLFLKVSNSKGVCISKKMENAVTDTVVLQIVHQVSTITLHIDNVGKVHISSKIAHFPYTIHVSCCSVP